MARSGMDQVFMPSEFQSYCEEVRRSGKSLGLVPTMGALHDGHGELISRARLDCDVVAVSIFVNPLQFNDSSDYDNYPRNIESDLDFLAGLGVDVVFEPPLDQMHPEPILVHVEVDGLSQMLEGASRPGHFSGVATVVSKLFILAGHCKAYFGEKDFQQLAIINRLVAEMHFPVEVVGVPIVREPSGLALSSRNLRLSATQKASALLISRSLFEAKVAIENGENDPNVVELLMASNLMQGADGFANFEVPVLDYALVVDPNTLVRPVMIEKKVRLLVAATVGGIRLIDNISAEPHALG